MIIMPRSRRRDMDFIDEFHAQRRGIRRRSWMKWLFRRMDWRVRRG